MIFAWYTMLQQQTINLLTKCYSQASWDFFNNIQFTLSITVHNYMYNDSLCLSDNETSSELIQT